MREDVAYGSPPDRAGRPLGHRVPVILFVAALLAIAAEPSPAQRPAECARLSCWQDLHASECVRAAATTEMCQVFLQRLETARRRSYSSDVALLLGETLKGLAARDDVAPLAQERYLARSRAAYGEVVRREPLNAAGYLGLADVAETGEKRVEWLRGAVQAEFRPAHMELLAHALSSEIGGQSAELEAARFIEDAYTHEAMQTEKWRYGASAWQRYKDALERYPPAASERLLQNVVLRVEDDIDYVLLQRMLLEPGSYLAYLAEAFAILCEKSIATILTLDECMAGMEQAVSTAEGSVSFGDRRVLAEGVLRGMRTIAGESPPRTVEQQRRFPDWIDRLLTVGVEPVDLAADLLEARADYTVDLLERTDALLAAIDISPNRGDLRLKLGATYVDLELWEEALEQLRVARYFSPIDEHERVDELVEQADEAYRASFFPPDMLAATEP